MGKRVILIVLDSVGIGELPDAGYYGDCGSNTLGNIAKVANGLTLPNLERLGLGNIVPIQGIEPLAASASYAKLAERSKGKDTTTGHWEMIGIITEEAFPTYPDGFPEEVIKQVEEKIGCKVLGNEVASGTEIINRLGDVHINSRSPIVYTSADSVFQIAAHEDIVPLDELYDMCKKAREILNIAPHQVGRVIARPFIGNSTEFVRTANRHDYSLIPPSPNLLTKLEEEGHSVCGIGKIGDIFAYSGIGHSLDSKSNMDGINQLLKAMSQHEDGLIMLNLVEFDSKYGHRNDPFGYAEALREFDATLPDILTSLSDEDILIITADHGCDPTTSSTDHSREYVPLLVFGNLIKQGVNLGCILTFGCIGATIADYLDVEYPGYGESLLPLLLK